MPDTEELPFVVSLWDEDELGIANELACAASLSIGRAAFDTAAVIYPDRRITLLGPGVHEIYSPAKPEPGPRPLRAGRLYGAGRSSAILPER